MSCSCHQKLGNYCGRCLKSHKECTCTEDMFKGIPVYKESPLVNPNAKPIK